MEKIPVRHIKATTKEPNLSGGFHIRDIKNLLAGKDMVQELHRHSFYFMLILKKGSGEHSIDFTGYPVKNNSVFFMRPGQVHQLLLRSGSTGYLVGFGPDFYIPATASAKEVLRKVSSKNHCQLIRDKSGKLFCLLDYIIDEYARKQDKFEDAIRSMLDIFFIELLRHSRMPGSRAAGAQLYAQDRLEELQELIETHIASHRQVAFYAEKMHLTPFQLNAITRSTVGKTCSALINEAVILEAKRYLSATSHQINQIADQLGYEDPSYFIRFFKKHTGYTPDTFRRRHTT